MRREDNRQSLNVHVRVAVYCNVPTEGGFKIYGNKRDMRDLDRVEGEGFLVHIKKNGGTAILATEEIAGGRPSQKNVRAVWKEDLPMEYLPYLKQVLSELDYTQTGASQVTLYPTRLPNPSARLIAGMRVSLEENCCLVCEDGSYTEMDVLAAASRLIYPEGRLTLGLPLPAGAPHQDINLYPYPGFETKHTPDRLSYIARQGQCPKGIPQEDCDLACCMAEAPSEIVNLAKENQSERVYRLFDALDCHTKLTHEAEDEDLLTQIFDLMNDDCLNTLVNSNYTREKKIRMLQAELYASPDADSGQALMEGKEKISRFARLEGFFSAIGRGLSRFAHSRKVHFVFCLLLTVLFLGFCSMDLTPETVILFEDGSELVSAAIALIWGIFLGAGFGRRADRRGREREREEWAEDSGE